MYKAAGLAVVRDVERKLSCFKSVPVEVRQLSIDYSWDSVRSL
jgi:hypothetical protein